MHKKAKHIIASLFLLLFVFANTGFTIHKHSCVVCGKTSYGIVEKPECCHDIDAQKTPICCHSKSNNNCEEKNGCCKNEVFIKQLDHDYNTSVTQKKSFTKTLKTVIFPNLARILNSNKTIHYSHKIIFSSSAANKDRQAMLCVYIV